MPALTSDSALLQRCLSGDGRAAERLFRYHQDYVYRRCYGMLGHRQDAEDATQEVFVRAFSRLESFRGNAAFRTWLHRITVTTCLDLLRRRKAPSIPLDDLRELAATEGCATPFALELEEALACLSPEDRMAILLREVDKLSYSEIAEAMGCTLESVRSRLHRARRHFREAYLRQETPAESAEAFIETNERPHFPPVGVSMGTWAAA